MRNFAAWKLDLLDRMSVDGRLSPSDFRVAFRLLHYMDAVTGACFPAQQTIIADTGLGERAVRYALTSLCACGWLKIERSGSRKRGRAQNHYCFPGRDYRHADAGKQTSTTGTPAREYRHPIAGASLIEHFEEENTDKTEARKRVAHERGTRIPENFSPDISIALAEGMTTEGARRSALNFVDYWKNRPGAGGRKLDWEATWRIWARKDAADANRKGTDRRQGPAHIAEQALEEARRAHEREQQRGLFQ
ncbi:helix-turn-helix domain-containing protein [Rhizobium ecuadorense]|uniref:helix-turn-helix domain-containing protein n=1 Tax=Rhizobium ecuadorense TaxID=1671795 RepID=UPI00067370AE|nr:helix-turn-helix domain-containing protein [Rhizobium ecuadorense]